MHSFFCRPPACGLLRKKVLLGGYTAAFADFEKDDFGRWHARWKSFIDLIGDDIDFYSFQLYDFPGINHGQQQYRKGCNLEATFDLLEHYSYLKLGKVKPMLVSEYGSQLHDCFDPLWSPHRDWLCLSDQFDAVANGRETGPPSLAIPIHRLQSNLGL